PWSLPRDADSNPPPPESLLCFQTRAPSGGGCPRRSFRRFSDPAPPARRQTEIRSFERPANTVRWASAPGQSEQHLSWRDLLCRLGRRREISRGTAKLAGITGEGSL